MFFLWLMRQLGKFPRWPFLRPWVVRTDTFHTSFVVCQPIISPRAVGLLMSCLWYHRFWLSKWQRRHIFCITIILTVLYNFASLPLSGIASIKLIAVVLIPTIIMFNWLNLSKNGNVSTSVVYIYVPIHWYWCKLTTSFLKVLHLLM